MSHADVDTIPGLPPAAEGSISTDRGAPERTDPIAHAHATPARRVRVLRWLLLLTVTGAVAARLVAPDSLVSANTFLVSGLVSSVVAFLGARGGAPELRRARSWIALALALTWLGDTSWQVLDWSGTTADVSIADVFWFACYGALAAGLLGLLDGHRSSRSVNLDAGIDMAMAGVAAVMVLWETALPAVIADTSVSVWVRSVWATYPVLDCIVLVLLVRTLASRRSRTSAGAWLVSGMILWLTADFTYIATGGESFVQLMDIGWLLGAALLAAANLRGDALVATGDTELAEEESLGHGRLLLSMGLLLIPALIEMIGFARGTDPYPVPLFIGSATLVILASARGMHLIRTAARARARVEASDHYFRSLALNSSDAVLVVDASGTVVQDLHNLGSLAGTLRVPAGTAQQLLLDDVAVAADPEAFRAVFNKALVQPGQVVSAPLGLLHIDGTERWVAVRMVNLLLDPHVEGVVIHLHDITAHRQAQLDLERLALHDALTGLANRTLFGERIKHALIRSARSGVSPAVLFLDLDGFKTVNDTLGHDVGDLVLIEVAKRLEAAVRSGDTVSRLGGDEFAVLIEENHRGAEEAATTAERLQQALTSPISVGAQSIAVSTSIGIAVADATSTAATLLRDADVAMYRAKSAGRARSVLFETAMGAEAAERLQLEADLRPALDLEQFEVVYQPVIELQTERLVGFEALLRWNHPDRGTIMPDRFIPIAEDTGAIVAIGAWVLETACAQVAAWQEDLDTAGSLTLAVNLSVCQLACSDIVEQVVAALDRSGLAASSLVLEMTETALIKDTGEAATRLQELRDLGVKLAIDDFGTGYSSLSYLRQFPIDILKIDRSFIDTITDQASLPAIVRGLLDLGRTLGLDVVAEGVELGVQRDWLRSEQCKFAQGFLFARPLSVDDAQECIIDEDSGLAPSAAQSILTPLSPI